MITSFYWLSRNALQDENCNSILSGNRKQSVWRSSNDARRLDRFIKTVALNCQLITEVCLTEASKSQTRLQLSDINNPTHINEHICFMTSQPCPQRSILLRNISRQPVAPIKRNFNCPTLNLVTIAINERIEDMIIVGQARWRRTIGRLIRTRRLWTPRRLFSRLLWLKRTLNWWTFWWSNDNWWRLCWWRLWWWWRWRNTMRLNVKDIALINSAVERWNGHIKREKHPFASDHVKERKNAPLMITIGRKFNAINCDLRIRPERILV